MAGALGVEVAGEGITGVGGGKGRREGGREGWGGLCMDVDKQHKIKPCKR